MRVAGSPEGWSGEECVQSLGLFSIKKRVWIGYISTSGRFLFRQRCSFLVSLFASDGPFVR